MTAYHPTILGPEGSAELDRGLESDSVDPTKHRGMPEKISGSEKIEGGDSLLELDPTPPPDHEDFLEVRSAGLRSMRRKLAARRRGA